MNKPNILKFCPYKTVKSQRYKTIDIIIIMLSPNHWDDQQIKSKLDMQKNNIKKLRGGRVRRNTKADIQ